MLVLADIFTGMLSWSLILNNYGIFAPLPCLQAVTEAWNAITAKHPSMCAMLMSADAEKGKVLAYAGVPDAVVAKLKASDWVNAVLAVLGGKGGGKPTTAQGQGTNLDQVDAALATATEFAQGKL